MGPLQEIGALIIQTLGTLYLLVVILRFLLQLARADFYNPISQFAVKATNPVLIPLRKVIPGIYGIDLASVVLALLLNLLLTEASALVVYGQLINPLSALIWSAVGLLSLTVSIFFWGLLIMVIASWLVPPGGNPALDLLHQLVEPIVAPIRRIMPDMGGIDISPIFAFLALNIVRVLINSIAQSVGMTTAARQLVIGI